MTDYVTPTTWEQCAAHVEAGGVVEIEDAPGVWINDRAAATIYRGRCGTPGDGWAPRRLVPIESAAPANGVPAVPTGAERYLAERLADPEYRDAYEAAAPAAGDDLPPDGCEAVWLPTDVVDEWVGLPTTDYPPSLAQARATIYACREAPADFAEGTRTIRKWVNGGTTDGPALCEELDAWLDYWGGSPATTPAAAPILPAPEPPAPAADIFCTICGG